MAQKEERGNHLKIMQVRSVEDEHTGSGSTDFRRTSERRVGKYRVVAQLGRGGTAVVYLALARGQGGVSKLVVLKALLPEYSEQPGALAMFLDEARLAAHLNHPNVVQTYEVGTEGDRNVIVMEYLEGQALSRVLRLAQATGNPVPEAIHLRALVQMLEGLHYAHELKSYDGKPMDLVHRDVSPQNLFITYEGAVKVLDFGIAKAATSSTHTAAGVLKGKIAYMAPEQMSGETVDRRADVYSAGVMLWAAAAGQKLWAGFPDVQIMQRVLAGDIPSPITVNPNCSPELERIVMKALSCDLDERYATALELQSDLEHYMEEKGLRVKQREIGQYVSDMFAEARIELRKNIQRQLAEIANSDTLTPSGYQLVQQELRRSSITEMGSGSKSGSTLASHTRETDKEKRPVLMVGVVFALLAFAVGLVWFNVRAPADASVPAPVPPPAAAVPPAEPEPASPPKAPEPELALVRLNIKPERATVVIDGRSLLEGTTEIQLPISEQFIELTVRAEGYEAETRQFQVSRDMDVNVTLQAVPEQAGEPKAPPPRRPARPAPRPSPKPAAPAPSPKPSVDPCATNPFYLDANRIKRIRPECL